MLSSFNLQYPLVDMDWVSSWIDMRTADGDQLSVSRWITGPNRFPVGDTDPSQVQVSDPPFRSGRRLSLQWMRKLQERERSPARCPHLTVRSWMWMWWRTPTAPSTSTTRPQSRGNTSSPFASEGSRFPTAPSMWWYVLSVRVTWQYTIYISLLARFCMFEIVQDVQNN